MPVKSIINDAIETYADAASSPASQTGTDVYAITEGRTTGPWSVRNVLMQPQAAQAETGIVARTVLVEVDDEPGVLNQVTGVIARRGYNIQSLAVGNCEVPGRSRITIVLPGDQGSVSKLMKQIMRLVVVQSVVDLTDTPHVVRELMLIRVLPPTPLCLFDLSFTRRL
jgi:acetolactate synthase I/III small subunit